MDTKPGYKTPAFYLAILATLGSAFVASGASPGAVEGYVAAGITGLAAAGYAAFRAFKKSADAAKPAYKTSEFWLMLASSACSILYASGAFTETSMPGKVVGVVAGLLAMLGYQVTKPKAV